MSIPTVPLGSQGLRVSRQGLGCMGMSAFYGSDDEKESIATLQRAIELGATFWDTAQMYGWGANEELLGRVLAGRRDQVVIASKFGVIPDPTTRTTGHGGRTTAPRRTSAARSTPPCSGSAPITSTSTTSTGPTRTRPSRRAPAR
ncbi:MAG TPA: aldo/keto reductase [Lapillicoccus sp.]